MTGWRLLDRLALGGLTLALGLTACSAPLTEPTAEPLKRGFNNVANTLASCTPLEREVATAVIGKRGGEVATSGARLIIPEGALSDDVEFSLTQLGDKSNTIEISPSQIELSAAASLVLSYKNCEKSPSGTYRVVRVDESNNLVENLESVDDPEKDEVITNPVVIHVRYAVAW